MILTIRTTLMCLLQSPFHPQAIADTQILREIFLAGAEGLAGGRIRIQRRDPIRKIWIYIGSAHELVGSI